MLYVLLVCYVIFYSFGFIEIVSFTFEIIILLGLEMSTLEIWILMIVVFLTVVRGFSTTGHPFQFDLDFGEKRNKGVFLIKFINIV